MRRFKRIYLNPKITFEETKPLSTHNTLPYTHSQHKEEKNFTITYHNIITLQSKGSQKLFNYLVIKLIYKENKHSVLSIAAAVQINEVYIGGMSINHKSSNVVSVTKMQ